MKKKMHFVSRALFGDVLVLGIAACGTASPALVEMNTPAGMMTAIGTAETTVDLLDDAARFLPLRDRSPRLMACSEVPLDRRVAARDKESRMARELCEELPKDVAS